MYHEILYVPSSYVSIKNTKPEDKHYLASKTADCGTQVRINHVLNIFYFFILVYNEEKVDSVNKIQKF